MFKYYVLYGKRSSKNNKVYKMASVFLTRWKVNEHQWPTQATYKTNKRAPSVKQPRHSIVVQNIEDDLYCSQLDTSHCCKNFLFAIFVPDFPAPVKSPASFSLC